MPLAHAGPPAGVMLGEGQGGETVWVRVTGIRAAGGASVDLVAVFPAGGPGPERVTFHVGAEGALVPVPRRAKSVHATVGGVRSNALTVSTFSRDTVVIELSVPPTSFWVGFKRALGVRGAAARAPVIRVRA